jgi:hypothetical protein
VQGNRAYYPKFGKGTLNLGNEKSSGNGDLIFVMQIKQSLHYILDLLFFSFSLSSSSQRKCW